MIPLTTMRLSRHLPPPLALLAARLGSNCRDGGIAHENRRVKARAAGRRACAGFHFEGSEREALDPSIDHGVQRCSAHVLPFGRMVTPPQDATGRVAIADLWRYLEPEAQLALVILALAEVHGHVHSRDYRTPDLAHLDWYTPELDNLARIGLVDGEGDPRWRADRGNFMLWPAPRAGVGSGSRGRGLDAQPR